GYGIGGGGQRGTGRGRPRRAPARTESLAGATRHISIAGRVGILIVSRDRAALHPRREPWDRVEKRFRCRRQESKPDDRFPRSARNGWIDRALARRFARVPL